MCLLYSFELLNSVSQIIKAIPCPRCKQLYNKEAKQCPNCGYIIPNPFAKYLINNSVLVSAILYTNILFFIVSVIWSFFSRYQVSSDFFGFFAPHYIILDKLGMLYSKAIAKGEFFRFTSYMFLHGSLLHLLLNMFWFYYLSKEVKSFLNDSQIFLIYMISGIGGGVLALVFGGGTAVIGSSGAVFGLLGCLLAYGKKRKDFVGYVVWKKFSFLAFMMIIFGFLIPGISNSGHIGGAASGFGFSWLLFSMQKEQRLFLILYFLLFVSLGWSLGAALQIF